MSPTRPKGSASMLTFLEAWPRTQYLILLLCLCAYNNNYRISKNASLYNYFMRFSRPICYFRYF